MTMLFLARHGETSWNASRRLTGSANIPINKNGQKQAQLLAEKLRQWPLSGAYVSSLKRTHQTLDIIKSALNADELQTTVLSNFDERDCGLYTGFYKTSLSDKTLRLLDENWDYTPPEGESVAMVYERVISTFKQIIMPQLYLSKNILIVSHYNPTRLLVAYLDNVLKEQSVYGSAGNGSLITYSTKNTDGKISFSKLT